MNRGVPRVWAEDDFTHTGVVMKSSICLAARFGFDLDEAGVQGIIHEFPEYKYGDKLPGEVELGDKRDAESAIMKTICDASGISGLFELWDDFDSQLSDKGRIYRYGDWVSNSPVAVAYRNNIDAIIGFYRNNPDEIKELTSLQRYNGVHEKDIFDIMKTSFEEFHPYAKKKVCGESVFVDTVDAVVDVKSNSVGEIFDVFYRSLAGDAWTKISRENFLIDEMTRGRNGLWKLRIPKREVVAMLDCL